MSEEIYFFMLVRSYEEEKHAHFLLKCLRTFGGPLHNCPVLVFQLHPRRKAKLDFNLDNIQFIPIDVDPKFRSYWFGEKVYVCSLAEEMVEGNVHSLVWLNAQCLVLLPPILFDLGDCYDAAFRPVHIKNVGLSIDEPLDSFWEEIFRVVGIDQCSYSVRSFVDEKEILPYFNTHLFSIDPSKGILRIWMEIFSEMISNRDFQSGSCSDQEHQIFLHQAILSALITKILDRGRVRILPAEYSYPLHLHKEVPLHLRPETLNQLVCPVYEGVYQHPTTLNGLDVHEPLKTWITDNMPAKNEG